MINVNKPIVEILNEYMYELKGDCTLLFIGESDAKPENMKHFVMTHYSNYGKLHDYVKIRKFINAIPFISCNFKFLNLEPDIQDYPNLFSKSIDNKALEIIIKHL